MIMQKSKFTKSLIFLMTGMFLLVSVLAMAAENPWFVIKDTRGVCSVRQAKAKTPKTIAGPFATKAEAQKAKEESCAKATPASPKKEPAKKQL